MNQKILITLLVTIFVNGSLSSPISEQQLKGVGLPEEKPPTNSPIPVDHTNEKPVPSTVHVVPITQNIKNVSENATEVHINASISQNTTVSVPVVKKINETLVNHNATQVSIDTKNVSQGNSTQNSTVPTPAVTPANTPVSNTSTVSPTVPTVHPVPTTLPPVVIITTNATDIAKATTTVPSVKPSPKPTTTTVAPDTPTTNNVKAEHNTPPADGSHFDGASFIGGIVLTIGLTAIGFIAFKYYKSGQFFISQPGIGAGLKLRGVIQSVLNF